MQIIKIAVFIFTCAVLIGCFGEEQDVREYVDNIKKTSTGKVKPLPPAKIQTVEEFTARGLRSPFDNVAKGDRVGSMIGDDTGGQDGSTVHAPRPDADRKREYLERFPIENYDMVGTLSKDNYIWGLVEDKTGMVHPVKIGDYIGQNSGRVIEIDDMKITVIETVDNGDGGWVDQTTEIPLKTDIKG